MSFIYAGLFTISQKRFNMSCCGFLHYFSVATVPSSLCHAVAHCLSSLSVIMHTISRLDLCTSRSYSAHRSISWSNLSAWPKMRAWPLDRLFDTLTTLDHVIDETHSPHHMAWTGTVNFIDSRGNRTDGDIWCVGVPNTVVGVQGLFRNHYKCSCHDILHFFCLSHGTSDLLYSLAQLFFLLHFPF